MAMLSRPRRQRTVHPRHRSRLALPLRPRRLQQWPDAAARFPRQPPGRDWRIAPSRRHTQRRSRARFWDSARRRAMAPCSVLSASDEESSGQPVNISTSGRKLATRSRCHARPKEVDGRATVEVERFGAPARGPTWKRVGCTKITTPINRISDASDSAPGISPCQLGRIHRGEPKRRNP